MIIPYNKQYNNYQFGLGEKTSWQADEMAEFPNGDIYYRVVTNE